MAKAAWSLVNAAHRVARPLAYFDASVGGLINAMNHGCELAKAHPLLKGRHVASDFLVEEILREVIRGACIVKVYCEKRPQGTSCIEIGVWFIY